ARFEAKAIGDGGRVRRSDPGGQRAGGERRGRTEGARDHPGRLSIGDGGTDDRRFVPGLGGHRAMKLSLLNYNCGRCWSWARLIRMAQAMGCEGLEFRLERGFGAGLELETPAAERRRIRDRVAAADLAIASLGTSSRFDSPDPASRQAAIER